MLTANNYELVQNCVEAIIQYSHATLFTQLSIKVYKLQPPNPPSAPADFIKHLPLTSTMSPIL